MSYSQNTSFMPSEGTAEPVLLGMDVSSGLKAGGSDGNSAVVLNLARALAAQDDAGEIRFEAYAPAGSSVPGVPERFVRRIPLLPLCSPEHRQVRYGLAAKLTINPPDVLLNVASGYQPRLQRSKQMSLVHDVAFATKEWKGYYTPELLRFLHENTVAAARQADLLVAVSKNTANDLERLYGVPKARIRVVHSGYDEQRFRPEPTASDSAVLERLGRAPFLLALGTIQPRKNYVRLIRAFLLFRLRTGAPHRLVIAGAPGWMAEPTVALARQHMADGVVLWGAAQPDEVPALLRFASLFVFPALYEGFGIPLVEAMACGTAVVASNTGPVPEITSEAAKLFDPASEEAIATAIEQVVSSEDTRAELARRGLRRAKDFSWQKAARSYTELARQLTDAGLR